MKIQDLNIWVSFVTVADMTGVSEDEIEAAEGNLDGVLDGAMTQEFLFDAENINACLGAYDVIEAYDEDGNSINPDGEIAQRVARVVSSLKDEFATWVEMDYS